MDRIICVVGPTASGKTSLAVELSKAFDGEVVSCDSMLRLLVWHQPGGPHLVSHPHAESQDYC